MENRSCILLTADAGQADANRLLARIFGDNPETSSNLSVPLSASGEFPATHWAGHIWRDEAGAAVLEALPANGGTLPVFTDGLDWEDDFGITEAEAISAAAGMTVSVVVDGSPPDHLATVASGLGLQRARSGD